MLHATEPHVARVPPAAAGADFASALAERGLPPLMRGPVTTLQVNLGRVCNQACHHCHVDAGPRRTESMPREVAARVLALLAASPSVAVLDLTGGAPEACGAFRELVDGARRLGRRVIDRCNLTILLEPGLEDLAVFLAARGVEVVASLPCYLGENVDRQRGSGVFERSLRALRRLNALGYGGPGSPLALDLVFNPGGPELPPNQAALEAAYRAELRARHGVEFRRLLTITNMPIRRFAEDLRRTGRLEAYMGLLVNHFNPAAVPGLMCRSLLSVDWQGRLFDCDFHQMQSVPLGGGAATIFGLPSLDVLAGRPVATAPHCFGCTAGAGSSCGGALA